jgi:hypothetical protein
MPKDHQEMFCTGCSRVRNFAVGPDHAGPPGSSDREEHIESQWKSHERLKIRYYFRKKWCETCGAEQCTAEISKEIFDNLCDLMVECESHAHNTRKTIQKLKGPLG